MFESPILEIWTCPRLKASLEKYLFMKQEMNRFLSCPGLPGKWHQAFKNGFFKKDDCIQCFSCGLEIDMTLFNDDVPSIHSSFSPNCAFLSRRDPSLQMKKTNAIYTYSQTPVIDMASGINIPLKLQVTRIVKADNGLIQIFSDDFVVNPEKVYHLFRIRMNRTFSFALSPPPIHHRNYFVESGFFWTGFERVVQCAFCRIAFDGKLPGHPIIAHKKLSPDCPFIAESTFETDRNKCCVCLTKTHSILYLPCAHLAVCTDCDEVLLRNKKPCPICRAIITKRISVMKP